MASQLQILGEREQSLQDRCELASGLWVIRCVVMVTAAIGISLGWLGALPGRPWRMGHSFGPGMRPLGSWMLWELPQ